MSSRRWKTRSCVGSMYRVAHSSVQISSLPTATVFLRRRRWTHSRELDGYNGLGRGSTVHSLILDGSAAVREAGEGEERR